MSRSRVLLALAATLVLAAACSDQPAESRRAGLGEAPQLVGLLPGPTALLRCTPLPADSVTVTVGPAGASIPVGPHVLTIPPGALTSAVTITAVAPSDTVRRVAFSPDGLVFQTPAELQLSYANCDLLGSLLPKRVVQVSGTLDILGALISLDEPSLLTTTAQLPHFSGYAVAW